jgi:hypothetical protein
MMFWIGFLLALLTTIVVGWVLPLLGVAVVLPLLQVLFALNPWVSAVLMLVIGGLLVWYSITRQAWWQALLWGLLWGFGALTALVGWFNWYALFIEGILLAILLVPASSSLRGPVSSDGMPQGRLALLCSSSGARGRAYQGQPW